MQRHAEMRKVVDWCEAAAGALCITMVHVRLRMAAVMSLVVHQWCICVSQQMLIIQPQQLPQAPCYCEMHGCKVSYAEWIGWLMHNANSALALPKGYGSRWCNPLELCRSRYLLLTCKRVIVLIYAYYIDRVYDSREL
jgi:hypothetical protein